MLSARKDFSFFRKFEKVFGRDEIIEHIQADDEFFYEYALESWLKRYFEMWAKSRETHISSITSVLSDTPPSHTNAFKSKTEDGALRSVLAEEWIDYLHEKLDLLPHDYQEIIQEKYLKRGRGGRLPSDIYVFTQLGLSKTLYYRMRKDALAELGRLLYPK